MTRLRYAALRGARAWPLDAVQQASTASMIFDMASLVSILSEAFTLEAGDVIVSGTPTGVGQVRTPPLFMMRGDVCTVEVEGFLPLRNPVADATTVA